MSQWLSIWMKPEDQKGPTPESQGTLQDPKRRQQIMSGTKLQFPTTSVVKVSLKIKIKLSFIMHRTVYFLLKLNLWLSFTLVNRIKKKTRTLILP